GLDRPYDSHDHRLLGDGLGAPDRFAQLRDGLLVEILGGRSRQEAALDAEGLVRLLDDHLPLEVADLIAVGVRRAGGVGGAALQVEMSHAVAAVVVELGPPGHGYELLAIVAALVQEDLLQEVAALADLVGIEDHPGDLLEE